MPNVQYVGSSDYRVLTASDLDKADITGFKKTTFHRHETTEVDDVVAEALLTHEFFEGEFQAVSDRALQDELPQDELPQDEEPSSVAPLSDAAGTGAHSQTTADATEASPTNARGAGRSGRTKTT